MISIHAPRVGSDRPGIERRAKHGTFQSTLPVWGATGAPCMTPWACQISIHAPRVGSDPGTSSAYPRTRHFNPRSPCGERRHFLDGLRLLSLISIHAPRVGSDRYIEQHVCLPVDFNPRSPCGERLTMPSMPVSSYLFQSTLPVWGATERDRGGVAARAISIHAPRVGSDPSISDLVLRPS